MFAYRCCITLLAVVLSTTAYAETVEVGIGTQNMTSNTVTAGIVIKQLGLLDQQLEKVPRFKNIRFKIDWQNYSSGPPITRAMLANKAQIGIFGDYALLINGAEFQTRTNTQTHLVSMIAYNVHGAGNGVVVHTDSPYFELADLKGKRVTVPFGSTAHGMLLKAMEDRGWTSNYFNLSDQSPELGNVSLRDKQIDAHVDFVPFAELLPFRGFARKIFDGAQTGVPNFHGVSVRDDFAKKYPEFVVAYIKAMIQANEWIRANPVLAVEKIAEWTRVEKEVVYMFLGPGGLHTLDPTIKPQWIQTLKADQGVLQRMGRLKPFDVDRWADERYVRQAFQELNLDYDRQKKSLSNYEISGNDPLCGGPITQSRQAGEVWLRGGAIQAYSSTECTLMAVVQAQQQGRSVAVAYVFDRAMQLKLFADKAFYVVQGVPGRLQFTPFLLKSDAQAYAQSTGGQLLTYTEALLQAGR